MSDQSDHPTEPNSAARSARPMRRYGRRAIMFGAAATGAGVAASLAPGAAQAAPEAGSAVQLGKNNSAHATTQIITKAGDGLKAQTNAAGHAGLNGVDAGSSSSGHGIYGLSAHGTAIYGLGQNGNGVVGQTNGNGKSGAAGIDNSPGGGNGVFGQSAKGVAVWGSSTHGTGVRASSEHGIALQVNGKARLQNSGVIVVPSGQNSITHSFSGVTTATLVFATIQTPQPGLALEGAKPGNGSFTLTFSKKTSGELRVAWMLLD
jgi:hypothetical protein